MPRVIHFDIGASDPERAIKFYENVFGWKFNKWEGPMEYWLISTGDEGEPGIDGGLSKTPPGKGTTITIDAPNLDEFAEKITAAGGKITMPKMPIPSVGWFLQFEDPESNTLGLMEEDPNAG